MRSYIAPKTVSELLSAIDTADDPIVIAGGQSLLPAIRERNTRTGTMVDISRIGELKTIAVDNAGATVGAAVVMEDLMHGEISALYPALAEAAAAVGNHVIRGRSTLGGCLAWANPRAEMPIMMMALDAMITTQRRSFLAVELMNGPFTTILAPDEVILSVRIPPSPAMVFEEIIPRNSTGRAIVSVACSLAPKGQLRISIAGLTNIPLHGLSVPAGSTLSPEQLHRAIANRPTSDHFTSIEYRIKAACTLARRCHARLEAL